MTTTDTQNSASSVPPFLRDDEEDFEEAPQPRTVQQPENSAEPSRKTAESATIGADRQPETATIGSVLDWGDEEYGDEETAPPVRRQTAAAPHQPVEVAEQSESDAGADSSGRKRKMNPSAPKYGRTLMQEKDFLVMAFLRKFGFATSKQLGIVLGVKTKTAHRRALGLKEVGLVGSDRIFGATQLWYLKAKSYEVLDFHQLYDDRIAKRFYPGKGVPTKLEHTLAVIHVAAQLVGGVSEVRFIPGVELASGLDLLPALIPESYINREYSTAAVDKKSAVIETKPVDVIWEKQRQIRDWISSKAITKSQAFQEYPFLWTVVNSPTLRSTHQVKENHPADLVLDLSVLAEDWTGITRIAIEVELSPKQQPELTKIIRGMSPGTSHSLEIQVFDLVVYLTHSETIKAAVEEVAEEVTGSGPNEPYGFVKVLDLKDADGNLFSGKAWTL